MTNINVEIQSGSWVTLYNGVEPPSEITDGAGNVIFVAYNP